jgi:hypothetical protein
MKVQRICFLGTRTGNFDATSALFRDVLGLHHVHTEAGWSIFQLPSGRSDFVEVFGPEHQNASVFPAEVSEGIVVAFAVARWERLCHATGQPARPDLTSSNCGPGTTPIGCPSGRECPPSGGTPPWLPGQGSMR